MPWGELAISILGPLVSAVLLWVGRKITKLILSVDHLTDELTLMRGDLSKLHKRMDVNDRVLGDLIGIEYDSIGISEGSKKRPVVRRRDREH